jgi:tetratricopeptide (TPR) repeat protein
VSFAQEERSHARDGNDDYSEKNYAGATKKYEKSLSVDSSFLDAKYNLANAQYKLQKYDTAARLFNEVAENTDDKKLKSNAYHNLGNAKFKQKKYQESVNAYKQALINDPENEEARYNLSYAMRKLREQQEKEKNQDKKDQNKDDKKKDQDQKGDQKNDKDNKDKNKKDDKKKDDQDKKDQQDKNKGDQKDKEKKPQDGDKKNQGKKPQPQKPNPQKLSKEDARRMLEAIQNDERQLKKKLEKKKGKAVDTDNNEKNW